MATKDGRAQIWYADGSGNVTGYTESVGEIASTIIDAYNNHFGTDIGIWTPETKTLQVGDTVPNWDAYEKIEIPSQKIAAKVGVSSEGNQFIIGTLNGENFEIITNGNQSYVVNSNGVIANIGGPPASYPDYIKGILQSVGITATSITEKVVSWEVGSSVPDWSEYTQYA